MTYIIPTYFRSPVHDTELLYDCATAVNWSFSPDGSEAISLVGPASFTNPQITQKAGRCAPRTEKPCARDSLANGEDICRN